MADILKKVFNEILENQSLSPTQRLAIITLIFKKKGDKIMTNNYRPISLTNCDYKILAYIFSNRLEPFLCELIHPNQMAYMSGRFIGTNVWSVQDVINVKGAKKPIVLFLDFLKAFDSVNHLFMLSFLIHIGLPPRICQLDYDPVS